MGFNMSLANDTLNSTVKEFAFEYSVGIFANVAA